MKRGIDYEEGLGVKLRRAVYRKIASDWTRVCTCDWVEDARWIASLLAANDSEGLEYAYTDDEGELCDV